MPFRLVPPLRGPRLWIRFVPYSMRFTGRQGRSRATFHALWDKVFRRDVLWRAWVAVCINSGAPGIDKAILEHIEQEYGIDRLLGELAVELRDGSYRPMPTRRVWIPKPGTSEQRPLSIPTEAA